MKFTSEDVRRGMLLYAITDRSWLKDGETLTDVCREVLENGATFLQIREKELDTASFAQEAKEIQALCRTYHVPCIVNDSVEIALAMDADGVHVGQSDLKGRNIRELIGPDKILGISVGTVEEALTAQAAGADYVGVGAVFGTSTKKDARNMTPERLREISEAISVPVVAIGGINAGNILQLKGCGMDGAAVISAIFGAEQPGKATAELRALAAEAVGEGKAAE